MIYYKIYQFRVRIHMIPQESQIQGFQEEKVSKSTIIKKLTIIGLQACCFTADINIKQFIFYQSLFYAGITTFCIICIQFFIWYRFWKNSKQIQYNKTLTIIAHLKVITQLYAISSTLQNSQGYPKHPYFIIFVTLIFNYMIAIFDAYLVFKTIVVKDSQHFWKIIVPIDNTFNIIYTGMVIGSFIDMLAFSGKALIVFVGFIVLPIVKIFLMGFRSKDLIKFKQAFLAQ